MQIDSETVRAACFSGAGAAIASLAAITLLARMEGKPALQPVNATSHVLHGPEDARRDGADLTHTVPGAAINIGAAFFWGSIHTLLAPPGSSSRTIVERAALTALAAGIVDYGIVPRRLTPGWEHSIRPGSVALAIAMMGVGLAAGRLAAPR